MTCHGLTVLEGCMRVGLRRFRVSSAFCAHREQEHFESVLGELKTCFCSVTRRELNHKQGSFLIFNSERQYRTLYSLILSGLPPHTIDQSRLPSYLFRRDFYLIFVYDPISFHSKTSVPSFRIHLGARIAVLTKSNIALNVLRLILRSWVIPRRILQLLSINRDGIV